MRLRALTLPGLLLLMTLTACSTTQPMPAPQRVASPAKAIPCVEAPIIRFHAPANAAEVGAWLAGKLPDPSNVYDTPETVAAVRRANAARAAVCSP